MHPELARADAWARRLGAVRVRLPDAEPLLGGEACSLAELPADPARPLLLDGDSDRLPLLALRQALRRMAAAAGPEGQLAYLAGDPEALRAEPPAPWPGELRDGRRYRPLRQHVELARVLELRPLAPLPLADDPLAGPSRWWLHRLRAAPAGPGAVHGAAYPTPDTSPLARCERAYGQDSAWRRLDRAEEPEALDDLLYALRALRPRAGATALALGCNDARELQLFAASGAPTLRFVGIDASASAVAAARQRFPDATFLHADLETLAPDDLPRWDLLLALGLLQSPRLDRQRLLKTVLARANPGRRVLLSLPAATLGPDDLRRQAPRDHPRHDRGPLHKDLRFLTRLLYRQGFERVACFGTYDAYLLAW